MAGRPRAPKEKAIAAGRDIVNAGRYEDREEIDKDMPALGEPPDWIVDGPDCLMESAWRLFMEEAPWLKQSHRMLVAMASQVQGCLMAGTPLEIKEMMFLKSALSSMGMTPADAGKVMIPDAPREPQKGDITAPRKRR